jgi:hypothetical protein
LFPFLWCERCSASEKAPQAALECAAVEDIVVAMETANT